MSLTTILQQLAYDLAADSEIESTCTSTWGRSVKVYRRVGQLYLPDGDETPLVQIFAGARRRSGNYMLHSVTVAVFAGALGQPVQSGQVLSHEDEAAAESLAERVEIVATQSLGDQGVAGEASGEGGEDLSGPMFVAAYEFEITLPSAIPL